MLVPVDPRTHSSQLPGTIHLLVPLLDTRMSMAPVLHGFKTKIRVPLVGCVDLMMSQDLRVRDAFVLAGADQMLGTDEWITQKLGRAHEVDEFVGWHVFDELVSHDAVVNLFDVRYQTCYQSEGS